MIRSVKTLLFAAVLGACAGPSAAGQAAPASGEATPAVSAPAEEVGRLHLYEVPSESRSTQEAPEPGWIQVSGTGSVEVQPDRASVAFAVESRARDAAGASQANADAMDAVLRALRGANLTGLELETFGYSLRPEYIQSNDRQGREIVAYVTSNNVRATVTDVDLVGRVIDTAIGAGANRVAGISFEASDTEGARNEAMAQAVRDATAEARIIAETLGYRLGPPLEVNGGAQRPVPYMAEAGMIMSRAQAAPTPIEAGAQTVTANVSIRFALGPRSGG